LTELGYERISGGRELEQSMKASIQCIALFGLLLIADGGGNSAERRNRWKRKPLARSGRKKKRILHTDEQERMEVSITNYGGTVTSIRVPDKNGN